MSVKCYYFEQHGFVAAANVPPGMNAYFVCDTVQEMPTGNTGDRLFCVANATHYVYGSSQWNAPTAGPSQDAWTYLKVTGSDFTTSLATAQDVTGLGFTPAANTNYEFDGELGVRTATATVNPRPGLAWPTGMTDGWAAIQQSGATATAAMVAVCGNINAPLLLAVGGLPNNTQSWPVLIRGVVRAGASPLGNVRVQLASETALTTVRVVIGSFLRYRIIP